MNFPSRVIALDFETTGLIPAYDSPTSLSAIVFDDGEPTGEMFSVRIQPSMKCKLSLEALAVQGGEEAFNPDTLAAKIAELFPKDACTAREAFVMLQQWGQTVDAARTPVVAQKASFDWGFYDEKIANWSSVTKAAVLSPVWICTKTMARLAMPDMPKVNLASIAVACGIEVETRKQHESTYDALLCGHVYFKLKAMLEGTREPVMLEVVTN